MSRTEPSPIQQQFLEMLDDLSLIPPYNSERYETTDGLDNADFTNGDRAVTALEALCCFQIACGMNEDTDTASADLICNLLHLVYSEGHDPKQVLQNGIEHFLCESGALKDVGNI